MENQDIDINKEINRDYLLEVLKIRIKDLDIVAAKRDVEVFIADKRVLDIWSRDFFMEIIKLIKFKN